MGQAGKAGQVRGEFAAHLGTVAAGLGAADGASEQAVPLSSKHEFV